AVVHGQQSGPAPDGSADVAKGRRDVRRGDRARAEDDGRKRRVIRAGGVARLRSRSGPRNNPRAAAGDQFRRRPDQSARAGDSGKRNPPREARSRRDDPAEREDARTWDAHAGGGVEEASGKIAEAIQPPKDLTAKNAKSTKEK